MQDSRLQLSCGRIPAVACRIQTQDTGLLSFRLDDSRRGALCLAQPRLLAHCRGRQRAPIPFASITGSGGSPQFPQLPKLPQLQFPEFNLPWFNQPKMAAEPVVNLAGTWLKDGEKSESMEEALKLMEIGGMVRTAIRFLRGVEIKQSDEMFEFGVFSALPFFKVTERYPLSGEPVECKRRDLRGGKHKGSIKFSMDKAVLSLEWGEPHGGHGADEFWMSAENELSVKSIVDVGAGHAEYTQVYRRKQ